MPQSLSLLHSMRHGDGGVAPRCGSKSCRSGAGPTWSKMLVRLQTLCEAAGVDEVVEVMVAPVEVDAAEDSTEVSILGLQHTIPSSV